MRISDWSSDVCPSDPAHNVASSLIVASIASGAAPPDMPECDAGSRVRTRSVKPAVARSETVSAGVCSSQLPESATTIASARRASRLSERNCANEREPYSSSPSMKTATPRSTSRSEEHTSELQSLMRISYAVFCLKKKKQLEHI